MLKRLYVDNYRCFTNFELVPGRRTLLLGYNGAGKTSIFDVLGAVQALIIWDHEASDAFPTDTVSLFADSTKQRVELDVQTDVGLFKYVLVLESNLDTEQTRIHRETVDLDGEPLYHREDAEVQLFRDDHSPGGKFSFNRQRSFIASLEPKPTNRLLTQFRDFIEGILILDLDIKRIPSTSHRESHVFMSDGSNFASWFRHLTQEDPDAVREAVDAIREVLPGFRSIKAVAAGKAKVLTCTFAYPGGKPYDIDFEHLSDGQRAIVILYTVLKATAPHATVLCFDEPDNFVSLREIQPWLVELSNAIDDHSLQTMLISHSPEIIDFIGSTDAILLERSDGGYTRIGSLRAPKDSTLRLSQLVARGWHV